MAFPFKYKSERVLGSIQRRLPIPRENVPVLGSGEVHLWGWFFTGRRDTYAIVRRIASGYRGCMLREVCLRYLPGGKPYFGRKGPHFSLSHTGERVLVAFAWFFVGLDIEKDNRSVSVGKIASRCFHSSECLALASCPKEDRQKVFLRMWVRKEAAVKLAGEGITPGLQKIKIETDTRPWRVYREGKGLYVKEINPWPGVVGALVADCRFTVAVLREN
ncbi:4'-phosphopantetheinyl transferase psf-1 [Candidatus Xiphinematobacter sp. Idaho Grape]|uniref:4'-phosphopantetheinyl transferase family protein n=1 Tax=Candidatus Xiphinematobacter sp. Idaho Grape TaxID=1704307 RepID=UPI000705E524|nr:4'-phosphopantetheinyl transferase superfamily protein [Candidatus Xiphinematobacter sp. Idaho Grape]ALJ56754.1 4'-phosphopantetheinyl transferase psf-1 [Candidatus Xiphinematobacter sp. Idaho Grape]